MKRGIGLGILILLSTCTTTMAKSDLLKVAARSGTLQNLIARFGEPVVVIRHANSTTYVFRTSSERYNMPVMSPQVGVATSGGRPAIVVEPPQPRNRLPALTCTYVYEIDNRGGIISSHKEGNGC